MKNDLTQYEGQLDRAWIQTRSGKKFNPLMPHLTPEGFCIVDAAHALSMQCRFSGHTSRPYSVSEHCVRVSWILDYIDKKNKNWGLAHDLSEAYLIDLAKPVKQMMPQYMAAEKVLMSFICEKLNLSQVMPESVDRADRFMLAVEARDLMGFEHNLDYWKQWEEWVLDDEQLAPLWEETRRWDMAVDPWSPEHARRMFLFEFEALFPGYPLPGFPTEEDYRKMVIR